MKKGVERIKDVKETLPFRLLVVSVLTLMVLMVAWVSFRVDERVDGRLNLGGGLDNLGGELGTLKWDFNQDDVVFVVLNYSITNLNQSIEFNVNWSGGNQTVGGLFVSFERTQGNCNVSGPISESELPVFGYNKTFNINSWETNCEPSNFTNITSINAFAQIHVNLTQTTIPIPNITIYNDDSLVDVVDLDDYFSSLVNISYIVDGAIDETGISVNGTTNKLSFNPRAADMYAIHKFNLTASEINSAAFEGEGDVLDVATSGSNMTFYVEFVDGDRPLLNEAPSFNRTACDDLEWEMNTNYSLNMTKCWYDHDGDDLEGYRYSNDNANLTIIKSGNVLKLVPDIGWWGGRDFNIYVNDSKNESVGDVDFDVVNSTTTNNNNNNATNTTNTTSAPKITTSSPLTSTVSIFENGTDKTFSISASNYDEIKWYLNGRVVKENATSFNFSDLQDGDIIKVDVINGTRIDSKTWNIEIESDDEYEEPVIEIGMVIFYAIIAIIGIIIFLVIWLIIAERNKKPEKNLASFGFVGPNKQQTNNFMKH